MLSTQSFGDEIRGRVVNIVDRNTITVLKSLEKQQAFSTEPKEAFLASSKSACERTKIGHRQELQEVGESELGTLIPAMGLTPQLLHQPPRPTFRIVHAKAHY